MTQTVLGTAEGDILARRNAFTLAAAQALLGASNSIVIATGGLAGHYLAEDKAFATVPVTTYVLGSASTAIPASLLMGRVGRRIGFMTGTGFGVAAGLVGAQAVSAGSFLLLCLATFLAGVYASFGQYYRFAAADTASPAFRPKAIAWVMAGGIFAGVIGPQVVIFTKDLFDPLLFAGTYLAQSAIAVLALLLVSRVSIPLPPRAGPAGSGRPLGVVLTQPRFLVAAMCGAASYAVMNFVMTGAPLAMVACGHSVAEATLGIQWHVLAMFGPSFFTGGLIARFGKARIVGCGFLLLATSAAVGLSGLTVAHFWAALVLLGLGWNFAFIGATAMVTDCHGPEERAKVQAANDFIVWGSVAIASLSSGLVLSAGGWAATNMIVLPFLIVCLAALILSGRWREGTLPAGPPPSR